MSETTLPLSPDLSGNAGAVPARRKITLRWTPLTLVTLVWLGVFIIRSLPLVSFAPLRSDVRWFLFLVYIAFAVAYFLARSIQLPVQHQSRSVTPPATTVAVGIRNLILYFAVIGGVGALARGIDMVFLRGLDYSEGISAARLENIALVENVGVGTRPLSAIGKLLMGCSTVAIVVASLRFENLSRRLVVLAATSWLMLMFLSVLEGGRNTIAVNLLLLGSAGIVRWRCGKRFLPFGSVSRGLVKLSLVAVLGYMLFVFVDRFSALGYTDDTVISGIERTYSVEVVAWIKEMPAGPAKSLLLGFVMLIIYVGHGLDQIGPLFDWLVDGRPGYGRYNLDLLIITLERVGVSIPRFAFSDLPKPGLYFTGLGEILLDLGFAGTQLFFFVAGLYTGSVWRLLRRSGHLVSELLLSFAICWILASPLYSILPGFLGVFLAMIAFFVAIGVQRRLRRSYAF